MDPSGKAVGDQRLAEGVRLAEQNTASDLDDAIPAVTFDNLGIEQACIDAPGAAACVSCLHPGSEMGREGIEVERQAITGKHRETIGGQTLGNFVHQLMRERLGPRAKHEGWDEFCAGITGNPEPGGLGGAAEFQAEFIELDMRQMQSAQEPLV